MKLFAVVISKENIDMQDEMIEISERCPIILQSFKDKNSFYRSFMV